MSYIPRDYWLQRGKVYKQEFQYNKKFKLQEQTLIEYLKKHISFSTVLELGVDLVGLQKYCFQTFPKLRSMLP